MRWIYNVFDFVRNRPAFVLLIVLLSWISLVSVHPNLYLIGWDNYSSYLGGWESVVRTFFSTWRAYRGIGVPGDSESTDVFRQLLLLVFSPIIAAPMLDQLYIIACLWIGAICMYKFAARLAYRIAGARSGVVDLSAGLGALAYVTNLNTLATFYFPIVTYITRFASLPLLLLAFDRVIHEKHVGGRIVLFFIIATIWSYGSFITGTVFITTVFMLATYVLFQKPLRRGLILLAVFISMNMFWVIPFANYTLQKSAALRLAPVFIDTNETQLNLSSGAYSLWNQLIMYPNFFATRVTSATDHAANVALHPITELLSRPQYQGALGLLPIVAIMGLVAMMTGIRANKPYVWMPIIYVFFVLLSTQEHTPLGFIPAFLNTYVPYFQVIFRFGDTKFHPYIALVSGLSAGFFIAWAGSRLGPISRSIKIGIGVSIICVMGVFPLGTVYRSYLTGNFLPKFLFVSLPGAYREVASVVNSDKHSGRLLHLPFDPELYWRSHQWGYMGSAFMQYMLRVPYMDKTFEPGSLETTDFYSRLARTIGDAAVLSPSGIDARADEFLEQLRETGVSWILYDDTVSSEVPSKNIVYWGAYNTQDAKILLDRLMDRGDLAKALVRTIDLDAIAGQHTKALGSLTLYRVKDARPDIAFIEKSTMVDAGLSRPFGEGIRGNYVQNPKSADAKVYPLLYKDAVISETSSAYMLRHAVLPPMQHVQAKLATQRATGDVARVVQVSLQRSRTETILRVYDIPTPGIGGTMTRKLIQTEHIPLSVMSAVTTETHKAADYRANWHVLPFDTYSPIRIAVDGVTMPVPRLSSEEEMVIATTLVTAQAPHIQLLRSRSVTPVTRSDFRLTDNPNCFGDAITEYEGTYNGQTGVLTSKNGSTCIITHIPLPTGRKPHHIEVGLTYRATDENNPLDSPDLAQSDKSAVATYIAALDKPNSMAFCLQDASYDTCANLHQSVGLDSSGTMIFPSERLLYEYSNPFVRLALIPIGQQSQRLEITSAYIEQFDTVVDFLLAQSSSSGSVSIQLETLDVTIPKLLSKGSYYPHTWDVPMFTNQPCGAEDTYRTLRTGKSSMIAYVSNCYQETSVLLPFDSRIPKLWVANYLLHAGKFPKFVLQDGFAHYINEYLSLYTGYPEVPDMLQLSAPEHWYRPYTKATLDGLFTETNFTPAYTWVPAKAELGDTRNKMYTVHQNSPNEGILQVSGQSVIEIPPSWKQATLVVGEAEKTYAPLAVSKAKRILPSLWKIDVQKDTEAATMKHLLIQRDGYDAQWRAYTDLWSVLFGFTTGMNPIKCNGFANCYEVPTADTYYLLYTPERLAVIGWLITAGITASLYLRSTRRLTSA